MNFDLDHYFLKTDSKGYIFNAVIFNFNKNFYENLNHNNILNF